MPQAFAPSSSLIAIARPRCPKCQIRMSLAQVTPGPTGFEQCTFVCGQCDHVHQEMVAHDPTKSANAGWFAGELKRPE